jgi:hypothetical protein
MNINKFNVIVWVRKTGSFPALRDELLRLAGSQPDESTSYEGMVDFHWGFSNLEDAEHVAAAFSQMASRPDGPGPASGASGPIDFGVVFDHGGTSLSCAPFSPHV